MEKNNFRNVSESLWRDVVLVGGGPSLKGFDFEKLRGRTVVAINDALLRLPWATAMFSADRIWIKKREQQIKEFLGEKYLAVDNRSSEPLGDIVYLKKIRATGLSHSQDCIHISGSSGYGALNLAFIKGAKKITLLGFDYTNPGTHFYEDYEWRPPKNNICFPVWASDFTTTAETLLKHGVSVLNASLDSAITAFPKIPLDEV